MVSPVDGVRVSPKTRPILMSGIRNREGSRDSPAIGDFDNVKGDPINGVVIEQKGPTPDSLPRRAVPTGHTSPVPAPQHNVAAQGSEVSRGHLLQDLLLQQPGGFHGFLPTPSFRCSYTVLELLLSLATPAVSPLDGRVI